MTWYVQLQLEAGDVLLKVNGTDVNRFTTREGKEFAIYHAHTTYLRYTLSLRKCVEDRDTHSSGRNRAPSFIEQPLWLEAIKWLVLSPYSQSPTV